ncbi:dihydrofolate reductase family protein [Vibrio sp. SS-MA-C1-2]|uniref:dihydrofolate reductase family protein n=1 Tax=Vibrio sp. SS-MA-C1-2 TaxID=2908646 RepID=UPI001F43CB37|nr:dihydrofolate reductase family protein [Vibrio sp. SS-MA-C1-2]UJF17346.1 dihydrofolate reductase family protein [Vibrio sp. SS-MA-C1-2]
MMKCTVFIATSVDGYIADKAGSVDWLHTAGNTAAEMGDQVDMGWNQHFASFDCLIMGRKCMEVISNMNLTPEQWPYGDKKIIVLSRTLTEAPENMRDKVELYSGDINQLVNQLAEQGYQHAYIDGGTTIQHFLNLQLIDEMIITRAPILLGGGIPLFGQMDVSIKLEQANSIVYPNDFVQVKYKVSY